MVVILAGAKTAGAPSLYSTMGNGGNFAALWVIPNGPGMFGFPP
jgi:hypothetical protein